MQSDRVPGTDGFDCSPATSTVPVLAAEPFVTTGLDEPLLVTFEPSGRPDRLFIVERAGRVRLVEGGQLMDEPFLDIKSKVSLGGERGLLGMAFHPDYERNGLFYLHYSDGMNDSGDTVIEEYAVEGDADVANPDSARRVLTVEQPYSNHNGGSINFGADGHLYIALGDGGSGGDPQGHGQNLDSLLGKILRIDPEQDADLPYRIPMGNLKDRIPSAAPEIWDYGLRNPFRTTFDGCTGDLYIGDVGQDSFEELDIEKRLDGGRNYGWKVTEGNACFQPTSACDDAGITGPVWDYGRNSGTSITGGAVYRGRAIEGLRGTYVFADYGSGAIWTTVYDRDARTISTPRSVSTDLNNVTQIVAINNGSGGELYLVSRTSGIFKLVAGN